MPRTEPPRPDADPAPMPQRPSAASPQPAAPARSPEPGGARYMLQLVQLRWIAAIGQVAAIAYARFVLDIGLPLAPMLAVVAGLALFNLASQLYWRRRQDPGGPALLAALLVDVAALTLQLYLGGGLGNPFVFLYLLQVALGAVLLRTGAAWAVTAAAAGGVLALVLFPGPVTITAHPEHGVADPYIQGALVCFLLSAVLTCMFLTRIGRILRDRDARLAALRQQAAEEEHIVRMGLLASGAAHELGTPLATLSVILGDWRRMPEVAANPELRADLDEMQAQLQRCKGIVSGILLSAGDARGEAPQATTLSAFLDGLVAEWRQTRPVRHLDYHRELGPELAIVSDSGLKQMIGNILDNALEASPDWVGLEVVRRPGEAADDLGHLRLAVRDAGPGFAEETLARFGKPYNSTKGRPGGGLGLFLSVNVARSLGGSIRAANLERGAEVVLELPLSSLALQEDAPGVGP
jgi:Signal transduction histidine kinase